LKSVTVVNHHGALIFFLLRYPLCLLPDIVSIEMGEVGFLF
jgi:hypothetical protein